MTFEEAKAKLTQLTTKIKNHNTNFKTYVEKKAKVLALIKEISDLIDKIVSRVGENSSAATQLQELINLITKDLPDMEGELTATELDDVISALVEVKKKLEEIVGAGDGSKGTWHHAVDDQYGEYYWNDVTGESKYKGDLPTNAKLAHKGDGEHKEDESKVHPQKSTSAAGAVSGGESKSSTGARKSVSELAKAFDDLPEGWKRGQDSTGRTYYYNKNSGKTQWEKP